MRDKQGCLGQARAGRHVQVILSARERVLLEEMGELLPAALLEACDLSRARSVLEIGCGCGEWLRSVAQHYPDLQCIGIEQDEALVKVANALAYRDGLPHAAFLATDMSDLSPALFPEVNFDLVQISFLGKYILTADCSALVRIGAALCRPGGVVCWTEAELPVTSSAFFERLVALVCEALHGTYQSFISEDMWELADLVAARPGSGEAGVECPSYQRCHRGITSMLGRWLRDAGCEAHREKPVYSRAAIDGHIVHERVYASNEFRGLSFLQRAWVLRR